MCTRFVYNGIDKIVGFNFDIDLSVQFTASSGRYSVLERPFSEANGRPFFS